MNMEATAADNIGALLVIAVIYCLVEMVRYWRRRNFSKRNMSEGNLFQQPPPNEDCPICFLTIPFMNTGRKYQPCCGKFICSGCIHAVSRMDCDAKCPFCRVPAPTSEEETVRRIQKRVEMNDAEANYNLGRYYYNGECGFPQDWDKALELWHRAGELGKATGYYNIGCAYYYGYGVERDVEKAKHYWELAAIGGNELARHNLARHNLGILEERAGNMSIALKHHMLAAECGDDKSLKKIREFYTNGHATRDDYAKALQAYQKYIEGIKSNKRDEAAAFDSEKHRYY